MNTTCAHHFSSETFSLACGREPWCALFGVVRHGRGIAVACGGSCVGARGRARVCEDVFVSMRGLARVRASVNERATAGPLSGASAGACNLRIGPGTSGGATVHAYVRLLGSYSLN